MEIPVRICEYCGKKFIRYIRPSWIPKGGGKYCSKECQHKSQTTKVETACAYCGKRIMIRPSRIREFNFCNRKCKEAAQSLTGGEKFKNMRPEHYGKGNGLYSYRKNTFKNRKIECSVCGYNIIDVLQVHHKDSNRQNNISENLDILCPTHHKEYQLGIRKY